MMMSFTESIALSFMRLGKKKAISIYRANFAIKGT